MNEKTINIGLIGFGTIGSGVIEIFNQNIDLIQEKVGKEVILKKVVDLDITTDRGIEISPEKLSTDIDEILEDPEISIVIELIGGYEPAFSFIIKALNNGKNVVTANKALLAKYWEEIISTAEKNNVRITFEASVGGGIPLLQPLNESLAANNFNGIYGIINGTANYILSKMSEEELNLDDVLKEAQEKGYAEQDPTFDIEGHDTAQKLIILTILGFGTYLTQDKFHVEGITQITPLDIKFTSKNLGYVTKLLGISRKIDGKLEVRVHPTLIPQNHLLASVNDVFNGVYLIGDAVGPVMMYGQGAGMMPTASAIMGDCIDIINNPNKKINYGPPKKMEERIKSMDDVVSKYYIRLNAIDQPGVLHNLSGILSNFNISLESVNQDKNEENDTIPIFLVTHKAYEKDIRNAINEIDQLPQIQAPSTLIRILDE